VPLQLCVLKKSIIDPSTIETVKLEGGECGGKLTSEDMQRKGYSVGFYKDFLAKNFTNLKLVE